MRRRTGLPEVTILCAPCLARTPPRRRRLALFDLGPGGPCVTAWRQGGRKVVPEWTGPDGADKVHLVCGCGHEVQIRRERILAALAAVTEREGNGGGSATLPL